MHIAGRLGEQRWDWCAEAGALLPALSPPLACHSVLLDLVSAQGEAKGPGQAPSFGFLPGPLGGQTLACLSLHRTRGNRVLRAQPSTDGPRSASSGLVHAVFTGSSSLTREPRIQICPFLHSPKTF